MAAGIVAVMGGDVTDWLAAQPTARGGERPVDRPMSGMKDVRVVELAARQHNRFSRAQLDALGISRHVVEQRLDSGRWIAVHEAVYAIAPVLSGDMGRWVGATLTEPGTALTHASAAAARGIWDRRRDFEVVTRPGNGGPRRYGDLIVHRSETIAEETTAWRGIPIATVPRVLIDMAPGVTLPQLARLVREALRLGLTTAPEVVDALTTRHRGRRGARRLTLVVARYTGLPVERCRSASEVRALEVLRDAGRRLPRVNVKVAGEEADLSWPGCRVIVEIDGPDFHLDRGEDERKQRCWERAGWEVRRLPSPEVFSHPDRLLALTPLVERP